MSNKVNYTLAHAIGENRTDGSKSYDIDCPNCGCWAGIHSYQGCASIVGCHNCDWGYTNTEKTITLSSNVKRFGKWGFSTDGGVTVLPLSKFPKSKGEQWGDLISITDKPVNSHKGNCECGGWKTGALPKSVGHADWCAEFSMFRETAPSEVEKCKAQIKGAALQKVVAQYLNWGKP